MLDPKPKDPEDPLNDPMSPESMKLLAQCQRFFDNNTLKRLPRSQPKSHQSRAVGFVERTLLPKLIQLFGSSEFFFSCFQKTSKGSLLLDELFSSKSKTLEEQTERKMSSMIEIGHNQMATELQHHYELVGKLSCINFTKGLKLMKGTLTS